MSKRVTANWSAFETRNSKSKGWKSTRTEYTVSASQQAIDDNNAAIARLLAEMNKDKKDG